MIHNIMKEQLLKTLHHTVSLGVEFIVYAYQISSPHKFLISHKLLFCYGANLGNFLEINIFVVFDSKE